LKALLGKMILWAGVSGAPYRPPNHQRYQF